MKTSSTTFRLGSSTEPFLVPVLVLVLVLVLVPFR
jgi:hypothetical protein